MTHVLVVEDNADCQRLLSVILARGNFKPIIVGDVAEALNYLSSCEELPGLILSDWNLPNINVTQFINLIRESHLWRQIPVALVSAHPRVQKLAEGLGVEFINKSELTPLEPFFRRLRHLVKSMATVH